MYLFLYHAASRGSEEKTQKTFSKYSENLNKNFYKKFRRNFL